jgi:outer membrane protein assembly factor BamD (BamD/ComL family)
MVGQRILLMIGPIVLGLLLALSPAACTSPERVAQEAYDLAQFEEKQGNPDHARQLYQGIIAKHSTTLWAEKAKARLAELQPVQP